MDIKGWNDREQEIIQELNVNKIDICNISEIKNMDKLEWDCTDNRIQEKPTQTNPFVYKLVLPVNIIDID